MIFGINEIVITKARSTDINEIKQIADLHRRELGFVRRPSLSEAIIRSEIFVAKKNGSILGFVDYRHRKDRQTTLYNIAVLPQYRNLGVGRKLIEALVAEAKKLDQSCILLKCPEELSANKFYEALRFQLREVEPGKHRRLNIWRWALQSEGER